MYYFLNWLEPALFKVCTNHCSIIYFIEGIIIFFRCVVLFFFFVFIYYFLFVEVFERGCGDWEVGIKC